MSNGDVFMESWTEPDAKSAEIHWSLFSAAVTSHKTDHLLRPFPPMFISDYGEKDLDGLRMAVTSMPCIQDIIDSTVRPTRVQLSLFQWLLAQSKTSFKLHRPSMMSEIQELTKEGMPAPAPSHVVEVIHSDQSEDRFKALGGDSSIHYGYHGSRVENFYSIIRHGLHGHLNKTSLFGEGTYLCAEPSVAMGYSPWSHTGWRNGIFGEHMSVTALCEIIDHPSVKRGNKDSPGPRRAPNSQAGDVPETYIVVTNNDYVRIKYLLIYTKPPQSNKSTQSASSVPAIIRRLADHKQKFLVLLYVILLCLIGLLSSKRFWMKVGHFYDEILAYTSSTDSHS